MQLHRLAALTGGLLAFSLAASPLGAAPPVERLAVPDTYYINYLAWTSGQISTVTSSGYDLVICEPTNITRAQVQDLQEGADGTLGTADDILVLGYISIGEDNRTSIYDGNNDLIPIPGGQGPRVDPRTNPASESIASTVAPDGTPSVGEPSPGGSAMPPSTSMTSIRTGCLTRMANSVASM